MLAWVVRSVCARFVVCAAFLLPCIVLSIVFVLFELFLFVMSLWLFVTPWRLVLVSMRVRCFSVDVSYILGSL